MENTPKDDWFKKAIAIAILLIGASVFYYFIIFLPSEKRAEKDKEAQKEQALEAKIAEENLKEEERKQNLQICLEESEYQTTSSHLWLCSSIGRTEKSCGEVFASSKNVFDSLANYRRIFGVEKTVDDFDGFSEKCNCGLEKYRRDEFAVEKKERDDICFKTYGN